MNEKSTRDILAQALAGPVEPGDAARALSGALGMLASEAGVIIEAIDGGAGRELSHEGLNMLVGLKHRATALEAFARRFLDVTYREKAAE